MEALPNGDSFCAQCGAKAVAFPVKSVARAKRFWVERLGFSLLREEAGRYAMVNLGTVRLMLTASAASRSRYRASV